MLNQAIEKIKTEIEQNKNNSYIQVVGGFLLQHLEVNPAAAEKVLAEGKTISKSLDEMRKAAEKKKTGNCAVLTDQEGFEVVLKYFGIDFIKGVDLGSGPDYSVVNGEVKPNPYYQENKSVDFDVKLEDLL